MSIEQFFTLQALVPQQGQITGKNGEALSPTGLQGLNFIDLILARLNENAENGENAGNEDKDPGGPLDSGNPLLDKNPELNLAELIAANPEIEQEIKDFIEATQLGPEAELIQTLSLNQQAFDDVLKPLTDGIITAEEIANGSPRILQAFLVDGEQVDEALLTRINEIKAKIQNAIEAGNGEILVTNLAPQEITALQNVPENFDLQVALEEAGVPPELIEKTLVALIKIIEAQPQEIVTTEIVAPAQTTETATEISDDPALQNILAILIPQNVKPQNKSSETSAQPLSPTLSESTKQTVQAPLEQLAARLNALTPGAAPATPAAEGEPLFDIEEFEGSLITQSKDGAKNNGFEAALKTTGNTPAPAADLSVLQNFPFAAGSLISAFETPQGFFERYDLSGSIGNAITPAALTSISAQVSQAGASHPATQMVAIQMQKAAGGGENKTIMLELDPPELGRVEVKMSFGKEKALKAVLTADKPETYMMLQRDSQTLERALQEIGLDTDEGISFELAEQGFDFEQDNQRGGGHDQGGTGAGDDAADEQDLIETTMTWHVDPETGHMRYNILA